jgi:hypothetical protein
MNPWMTLDLARLRQQELLDEAAADWLAYQARANRPKRQTSYLAVVYRRFIRCCSPVGLFIGRTAWGSR